MSHAKIADLHFARVGGAILNLSAISVIDLPPEDQADGMVSISTVGGKTMNVTGSDAAWLVDTLESRCDVHAHEDHPSRKKHAKSN